MTDKYNTEADLLTEISETNLMFDYIRRKQHKALRPFLKHIRRVLMPSKALDGLAGSQTTVNLDQIANALGTCMLTDLTFAAWRCAPRMD